jgi:opacity protein-like surface antigen
MMKYKGLLTITAMLLVSTMLATPAQAGKIYAGASVGESSIDFVLADIDDGSLSNSSVDDSDTAFKVFVGYRFLKFFAVEADTVDLGEFAISATSDGSGASFAAGPVAAIAEADGYRIAGVGILPVGGGFSVFAKAGIFYWDAETMLTDASSTVIDSSSDSDEFFGAGLNFDLKGPISIRLEYEMLTLDDVDVDLVSIGAAFRF